MAGVYLLPTVDLPVGIGTNPPFVEGFFMDLDLQWQILLMAFPNLFIFPPLPPYTYVKKLNIHAKYDILYIIFSFKSILT